MIQRLKNTYHKFQSFVANLRYFFPARKLVLIGVTGTDGKTTTVSMIYQILKAAGVSVGMISTIEVRIGEKSIDSGLHVTTPDPWVLPKYLKMMANQGITHVVVEATSSGLDQNRLFGMKFDAGLITNIRSDHLDYHKTWEKYAEAKFKLIKKIKDKGLAVLNADDEKSYSWINQKSKNLKQIVYIKESRKMLLGNKAMTREGLSFDFAGTHFIVPVLGEHNFENVLQAILLVNRYLRIDQIKDALVNFDPPLGRMQIMQARPFSVIIDFAHTPHALERALDSVIKLKEDSSNRIISVFGCAGKRDKGRREMGGVSAKFADITVLTAEDPRDEELALVNNEILKYAEKEGGVLVERFATRKLYEGTNMDRIKEQIEIILNNKDKPVFAFDENSIRSREDAIDFAIKLARPGDIVFITGKGHEVSLAFGDPEQEFPWSDQDVVRKYLEGVVQEG